MGTRPSHTVKFTLMGDHPHAYGDKKLSYIFHKKGVGSSPRVWGQVIICKLDNGNIRIIPTRMGTRKRKSPERIRAWDHPHAYGDKCLFSGVL